MAILAEYAAQPQLATRGNAATLGTLDSSRGVADCDEFLHRKRSEDEITVGRTSRPQMSEMAMLQQLRGPDQRKTTQTLSTARRSYLMEVGRNYRKRPVTISTTMYTSQSSKARQTAAAAARGRKQCCTLSLAAATVQILTQGAYSVSEIHGPK